MKKILLILFLGALVSGCSTTKKVARSVSDLFKKQEHAKVDSSTTRTKDSVQVKQSSKTEFIVDTSGYVKRTDETTVTVTKMDTTGKPAEIKQVTKKVTTERGNQRITTTVTRNKGDSTRVQQSEGTQVNKDTGNTTEESHQERTSEVKKTRFLSQWWLLVIAIVVLVYVMRYLDDIVSPFFHKRKN